MSASWADRLGGDPTSWLLDPSTPAIRAATLRRLFDRGPGDAEFDEARSAAMEADPISGILAAQDDEGWWDRPGPGYGAKYRSTVWNLMFLDQLDADPAHEGIQRACRYVMAHTATAVGGFGASGSTRLAAPPPSAALHCLNGNLVRALVGFGHADDEVVVAARDWAARTVLGEDVERWYASGTSGPGFACGVNDARPCAWGAIKELRGLLAVPAEKRTGRDLRAIDAGVEFLLSRDPAVADYPMPERDERPSSSWFKLGFPSGYVADVLQNLEVLAEAGMACDRRLDSAFEWLVAGADTDGRWRNRSAFRNKTTVAIEAQGAMSKWVTLRACAVLRARHDPA
jgi:hypothetical protein